MDIGIPLRDLGQVDSAALRDVILSVDDQYWLENSYRQEAFDVHAQTQSLMMLFVDTERWPDIEVSREAGWNLLAETAMPLMESILREFGSSGLTQSECEVVQAMLKGYQARAIAERLDISPGTVNVHRGNIHRKLDI